MITRYFDGHYEIEKPDLGKIQPTFDEIKYSILNIVKEKFDFLNQIDKNMHINWLKSLQRPDGGFSHQPGQASHITNTYFAIKALAELGALNQIDKKKVVELLISCQHPDGGFGQLPNQHPYLQYTYNAIFLLKILNVLNKIDLQKHINWPKSLQQPDGGFWPGTGQKQSQMNPTYFAIRTLMEVEALDQIDVDKLVEFILSL